MRALAALLFLIGCHDYDHFSRLPGDLSSTVGEADLAGCPARSPLPTVGAGCTLYTFDQGVPGALEMINAGGAAVECGILHVTIPAHASHDFWIDNLDAFRIQERTARSGTFTLTARIRGALDATQKFTGLSPQLRQQLLAKYQDGTFTNYQFERNTINAFFDGGAKDYDGAM